MSSVSNSSWVLYAVVAAFIFIMISVGLAAKKFVKTNEDFSSGGGNVPWWVAGLSMYMGIFSAYSFVSFGSVVFTDGGIGILIGFGAVFSFVVAAIFFAHLWHRSSLLTPVDYLESRFGPSARNFVAYATIAMNASSSALRLYAFSLLVNGLTGAPVMQTILIAGLAMALVATVGGLWGIVLADAVQFVVLLAGLVPLLILSIIKFGGWDAFLHFATTDMLTFDRGTRGWNWLLTWWMFQIIFGQISFPMIQRFSSVPTEKDARKAALLAAGLLIPTPFLALIPVAICFQLYPSVAPEQAFAFIAKTVLPVGLLGLLVGSMIAATVSELETAFNIDSGIFTRNIYQRKFRPDASRPHLLRVARIATLVSAAVAISFALLIASSQTGIFNLSEEIGSRMLLALCIPFAAGVLIRRLSERGFLVAVGLGLTVSCVLWSMGWSPMEVRLPLVAVGLASLVLGAIVFPPRGREADRVRAFFDQLARPRPTVETGQTAINGQAVRLVGLTILLMGLIPLALPWVASTAGAGRWVEFGLAALLFGCGAVLLFFGNRMSPKSSREGSQS